jgi:hypothetical protein
MGYRIDNIRLLEHLGTWNGFLKRPVRLIACGGTAMTLLGVKHSTKDIDLLVPELKEYDYLIKTLEQLGYKSVTGSGWARDNTFVFDIFRGKRIHTTELLESPLDKGNHILIKEFSYISLGVLNYYDIIISKLFRGSSVDVDDCWALIKAMGKEIDLNRLKKRFRETALYDTSEDKVNKNLDYFFDKLKKELGLLTPPL